MEQFSEMECDNSSSFYPKHYQKFLIGVCYIRVVISNEFVHVSMGRSVLMNKLSRGVDRGGALL